MKMAKATTDMGLKGGGKARSSTSTEYFTRNPKFQSGNVLHNEVTPLPTSEAFH